MGVVARSASLTCAAVTGSYCARTSRASGGDCGCLTDQLGEECERTVGADEAESGVQPGKQRCGAREGGGGGESPWALSYSTLIACARGQVRRGVVFDRAWAPALSAQPRRRTSQ
ncbi:hypothetical protein B0H11DRAFT_1983268, partial [Mycena galericulata]